MTAVISPTGAGWMGHPREVLSVLHTVGADRDEEGNFLIYGEPVITGLDGDNVVSAGVEYSVGGKRANLAAMLNSTSYGLRNITVI
jgi:hypothetical protein